MIEIKVDKSSEMTWIQEVIDSGTMNMVGTGYILKFLGVPLKQNIMYKSSDIYEDDIKEKREEYNKRFGELELYDAVKIIKEELEGIN